MPFSPLLELLSVPLLDDLLGISGVLNCSLIAPNPKPSIAPVPRTLLVICSLSIPAILEVRFCKQFCNVSASGSIIIAHIKEIAQPPPDGKNARYIKNKKQYINCIKIFIII